MRENPLLNRTNIEDSLYTRFFLFILVIFQVPGIFSAAAPIGFNDDKQMRGIGALHPVYAKITRLNGQNLKQNL